jgi:hypothetical protein
VRVSLIEGPPYEPVTLEEAKRHLRVDLDDDDAFITDAIAVARNRVEIETGRQLITAAWQLTYDGWDLADQGWWTVGLAGAGSVGGHGLLPSLGWWWVDLPRPPLVTVDQVTYVDPAGVTQVWPEGRYQVDAPSGPTAPRGRLRPAYGESWPLVRAEMNALVINFTAGYGDEYQVPPLIKRAILLMVGDIYEHREDTASPEHSPGSGLVSLPYGVAALLRPFWARPIARVA